MPFDVHSLEAYSTIVSVTGTNPNLTITVQSGDGAKFGNPQNVTIWPPGVQPTIANSTIGRISAIATDTLTVTTAQEGSANITVSAGMQIANTITPKVFTDIEGKFPTATVVGTSDTQTLTNKTIDASNNTISNLSGSDLASNTITATQIANGTITATQIASGTITGTQIASGTIDYANLLSTIFSGQVNSYTNSGSAAGTFYYINLGGIKILYGRTGQLSTSAGVLGTWTVDWPSSFFTSGPYVQLTLVALGGTALQTLYDDTTPTTTGTTVAIHNNDSTAGTAYIDVWAIGT